MKKVLLIFITVVTITLIVCGCGASGEREDARQNTEFQIWLNTGSCFVYTFKDEETGVWYVSTSEGVTPRLNTDGSLYVD